MFGAPHDPSGLRVPLGPVVAPEEVDDALVLDELDAGQVPYAVWQPVAQKLAPVPQ